MRFSLNVCFFVAMSAGDLEDLGSPLPSYPTLPGSPPKSGQQYQHNNPSSDSTACSQSTVPSGSGLFAGDPLPTGWGMTAGSSMVRDAPSTSQQAMQLHSQLHQQEGLSDQWLASNSSNDCSLSSNSANVTTPANIPIYATVKKPTNSPSMQYSNTARQRTTSGSPFAGSTPNASSGQPLTASTTSSPSTLTLRMEHLEDLCGKLTREKNEMKEEFGRQRKSFMNQMAQCDGKLSQYKHTAEKYSKEVQELSKVLLKKDEELQNVTIAAGITEATIREMFDADRVKYEEEIASLTKIVSGKLV